MTELGVGHEPAVVDDRRADAGAESGEDDESLHALGGPVVQLGDTGCVGVVEDGDLAAGVLLDERLGVGAQPGGVDVGGREHGAADDDGGHGDPDGGVACPVGEVVDDLVDDLGHGIGRRGLGRQDLEPSLGEVTHVEVDGAPLMPLPPMSMPSGLPFLPMCCNFLVEVWVRRNPCCDSWLGVVARGAYGRVRISLPLSVTRIVCSNCADLPPSRLTTVQPSSHICHSGVPRLSIGSIVKVMPAWITVP